MSENGGDIQYDLKKRENDDVRKGLLVRFRPFLSSIWRKFSIRSRLNGLKRFLGKNIVSTSIAVALALCYLLPKLETLRSKVVPYSELMKGLQNGDVTRVQFEENSPRISFTTRNLVDNNEISVTSKNSGVFNIPVNFVNELRKLLKNQVHAPKWQYSTRNIDDYNGELLDLMKEKGTTYGSAPESVFSLTRRALIFVLRQSPSWAMLLLLRGQLSAGNSRARQHRNTQTITFDDVEGVDSAKTELLEIVSCFRGDINYKSLGAKLPRGVLLVGPPGTGKTLLARAVAGKAGVPFFIISASEFVELFVGRGAARVRDLFNEARKCAPSIIFIDELDAIGGKRGMSFNSEGDQTLNQLLTEMDGFESDKRVVVIAATNRPEVLDPALRRPGRFSRKVFVGEPNEDGRRKILAVHLRGVPLEEDLNLICNLVASLTQGLVGADLANIVNEAALLAARRGGQCVSREDIMEATERAKLEINDRQPSHEWAEWHKQGSLGTIPKSVLTHLKLFPNTGSD